MTRPQLPAYADGLIAAYRSGQTGRDLHLGYWDRPPDPATPPLPSEFGAAQARLTERMIALAHLQPGQRVLDVACGFGGTLAAIAARRAGIALFGLNIDRRQLTICRSIAPEEGSNLALVEADACALPFAAASFDHVFCVEAMFHFRSRPVFLAEAARLLRPGGTLVVSDILLRDPGSVAPWDGATMAAAIQGGYGPWPELWVETASVQRWAAAVGLDLARNEDWTAETLPSYRTVAPDDKPELQRHPEAGNLLRWLHTNGWLTYQILVFRRGRSGFARKVQEAASPPSVADCLDGRPRSAQRQQTAVRGRGVRRLSSTHIGRSLRATGTADDARGCVKTILRAIWAQD